MENKHSTPKIYKKGAYSYSLEHCPGYKGYKPDNLDHEVCKHCGNISYYH